MLSSVKRSELESESPRRQVGLEGDSELECQGCLGNRLKQTGWEGHPLRAVWWQPGLCRMHVGCSRLRALDLWWLRRRVSW